MVSTTDVRRYFEAEYETLARMLRPGLLRSYPKDPERIDDLTTNAIGMAFAYCLGLASDGQIPNVAVLTSRAKTSTLFGLKQSLAGRMPHRKPGDHKVFGDVYDHPLRIVRPTSVKDPIMDSISCDPRPDLEAILRVDFAEWLLTLSSRNKLMLFDLIMGETGNVMAEKYGVSQGRVSQLRSELARLWNEFTAY